MRSPKIVRESPDVCLLIMVCSLFINFTGNPTALTNDEPDDYEYDSASAEALVLNGTSAKPGEFPHQVSLYSNTEREFFCGGSIITPRLILTAAHCLVGTPPSDFKVIAGLTDLSFLGRGNEQIRNVTFVYSQEDFNAETLVNDIAIIELDSPLAYSDHVRNISLPGENDTFSGDVTVIGWGGTRYGPNSAKLKKANVHIVRNEKCKNVYRKSRLPVTENNICAGLRTASMCQGDSGGPVICQNSSDHGTRILCGIASFGNSKCGRSPVVFTKVTSYIDWIEQAEDNIKAHQIANKLVENGVNLRDDNLETPLHQAADFGDKALSVKLIKLLIEMGSDVAAEDSEGYTFLHILLNKVVNGVASNQINELFKYLASRDLFNLFNIQGQTQGRTPLMLAAANVDLQADTLSLLHANIVNFQLVDKSGKSALFYAKEGSNNQKLFADILILKTTTWSDTITDILVMDKNLVKLLFQRFQDELMNLRNEINTKRVEVAECEGKLPGGTKENTQAVTLYPHPCNCEEIQGSCNNASGVYTIFPFESRKDVAVEVYCDLVTDGGGWTVFQRRRPPISLTVDFERTWREYAEGFHGTSMADSHWLGLSIISELTKAGDSTLRIDMTDWDNAARFAKYSSFKVANEAQKFKLTVGGFSGDVAVPVINERTKDSLDTHNGMYFTTKDKDNDKWDDTNCARERRGAWWYKYCAYSNLNGLYLENGRNADNSNIHWDGWHGRYYSLKTTEMKLRSKNFKAPEGCNEG